MWHLFKVNILTQVSGLTCVCPATLDSSLPNWTKFNVSALTPVLLKSACFWLKARRSNKLCKGPMSAGGVEACNKALCVYRQHKAEATICPRFYRSCGFHKGTKLNFNNPLLFCRWWQDLNYQLVKKHNEFFKCFNFRNQIVIGIEIFWIPGVKARRDVKHCLIRTINHFVYWSVLND